MNRLDKIERQIELICEALHIDELIETVVFGQPEKKESKKDKVSKHRNNLLKKHSK